MIRALRGAGQSSTAFFFADCIVSPVLDPRSSNAAAEVGPSVVSEL